MALNPESEILNPGAPEPQAAPPSPEDQRPVETAEKEPNGARVDRADAGGHRTVNESPKAEAQIPRQGQSPRLFPRQPQAGAPSLSLHPGQPRCVDEEPGKGQCRSSRETQSVHPKAATGLVRQPLPGAFEAGTARQAGLYRFLVWHYRGRAGFQGPEPEEKYAWDWPKLGTFAIYLRAHYAIGVKVAVVRRV
jgi:hypothetical protein